MPMRCYFLTRQVAVKFWPVYKSRSIFWTDFEDLKGRLIHRKIRYILLSVSGVLCFYYYCYGLHSLYWAVYFLL